MSVARVALVRVLLASFAGCVAVGCSSSPSGGSHDAGTLDATSEGSVADTSIPTDGARPPDSAMTDSASTDTSSPDSGTARDAGPGMTWWQPGTGDLPWQWELSHEIVTTSASDLGTGDTTYSGASAKAPAVYDIDGFDNTAADVSALHALGKKVICYIEVGAAENYRPDYGQFAAADLGSTVQGYPSEKYVNIKSASVVAIIEARIAMCAQKGFDGIEPDIDDSYTDTTGFTISEADDVAYLTALSAYAHSLGVAWGLKN